MDAVCGDGVVASSEACDDGNINAGDGCDASCEAEAGYDCTGEPSTCVTSCGDGVVAGAEVCDDNNATSGDGCDDNCAVEVGFDCDGASPTVCTAVCGDGVVLGAETCDDGNTTAADGCDDVCAAEAGYTCTGEPSVCTTTCGDGVIGGAETCDDGNTTAADGCDDMCLTETGYGCTGEPSVCAPVCGDGVIVAPETCDDMNTANGDGCDVTCIVETGYLCTGMPSVCTQSCGDGTVDPGEECDDGNMINGDRCDSLCSLEYDVLDMEPNDTVANAQTLVDGNVAVGSVDPVGDYDIYEIVLAAPSYLRLETYKTIDGDASNYDGQGTLGPLVDCGTTGDDTRLHIFDSTSDVTNTSAALFEDDDDGAGFCSYIRPSDGGLLPAGTYYVRMSESGNNGTVAQYALDVQIETPLALNAPCDPSDDICDPSALLECNATSNTCMPLCGNGNLDGDEECDDGNSVNGDRCDNACALEYDVLDTEPNDTIAGAQAIVSGEVAVGEITANDFDIYELTLAAPSHVLLELYTSIDGDPNNYNGNGSLGVGDCPQFGGTDPDLFLFDTAGDVTDVGTALFGDDTDAVGNCPYIGPNQDITYLPAGTYYIRVDGFTATNVVPQYALDVRVEAAIAQGGTCEALPDLCNPELLLGCDGTTNTCEATCGNGTIEGLEECDDANAVDGDRCSNSCVLRAEVIDTESNDTFATAQAVTAGQIVKGSTNPAAGDTWDIYSLTLASGGWVAIDTYTTVDGDAGNNTSDGAADIPELDCDNLFGGTNPDIHLYDATGDPTGDGSALINDFSDGDNSCPYIGEVANGTAAFLAAGTYYIKIDGSTTNTAMPQYAIDFQVIAPLAVNDACDPAADLCNPGAGLVCDGTLLTCQVPPPEPIDGGSWESFTADDFDLANTTLTYTPVGGSYGAIASPSAGFPETPGAGTTNSAVVAGLIDDSNSPQPFAMNFPFFGTVYNQLFVGSNGYVTFGTGDDEYFESTANHFEFPRIAGHFEDLDPSEGTSTITFDEYANRVVVTFEDVERNGGSTDVVNFQIVMFDTGVITVTYLNPTHLQGLVGLSSGSNLGNPPAEFDFSAQIPTVPAMGDLFVNEVLADPTPGADANCDGTVDGNDDEFVELVNVSGVPLDMTGVTLGDAQGVRHTFGSVVVPAGQAIVVYGGGVPACPGNFLFETASTGILQFNNGGDDVVLSTSDTTTYGATSDGESVTRNPDLSTSMFVDHSTAAGSTTNFSPGFRATGLPF